MAFESPEKKAERELDELLNPEPKGQEPESKEQEEDGTEEGKTEEAKEEEVKAEREEDPNGETFKQRWLSLQGIHRSEREAWKQEKRDLLDQIEQLKTRQPQTEDLEVDDTYLSSHVSDETRNTVQYRRMKAEYGQKYAELHFEAQTANKEEPPKEDNSQAKFFVRLDTLARNWRVLNQDPDFLQWLDQTVPYSGGQTIRDRLNDAVKDLDAAAAAQFFIDYTDSKATLRPPKEEKTAEELISPPKRGSETTTTAESHKGKVYTLAEYNEAWKKLELNSLPYKEAQELERDLTVAYQEGRVVG